MTIRQGILAGIFKDKVDPEADQPIDHFALKATGSQKEMRERSYRAQQSGSVMFGGIDNAQQQEKTREENHLQDQWLQSAVLGHMTPAQWDAQMVDIGGVRMTNAEAQAARKRIIDDPDEHLEWAKAQGLIQDGQEGEFLHIIDRTYDINAHAGENGGAYTVADQKELEELQENPLFGAANKVTRRSHVKAMEAREDNGMVYEDSIYKSDVEDAALDKLRSITITKDFTQAQAGITPPAPEDQGFDLFDETPSVLPSSKPGG